MNNMAPTLTNHQTGKLMADGASSNDTMAVTLSELISHFNHTDWGRCVLHILHRVTLRIMGPFDARPEQLEHALAEALNELDSAGDDLTSVGEVGNQDEAAEQRAERDDEEERHFRDIAADLAAELSVDECTNIAADCFPGAQALAKVRT